jgi:putative phage-type endonuclease
MEQRTEEWFQERLGKVTASCIADVLAKTKTGYSASRKNYAAQLITERLTGVKTDTYTNAAMQWGTEHEDEARALYQFDKDVQVQQIGFVHHSTIPMTGASPDGLVGENGLIEIKCPNTATHIDFLDTEVINGKYLLQMQWQMACTGRQWCDFVSYDPRMPQHLMMKIVRLERNDSEIRRIEAEVIDFLREIDEKIMRLNEKYPTDQGFLS